MPLQGCFNDLCNPSFFSAANIPYKPADLTGLNLLCQSAVITKMNKLLLFTIVIIMKSSVHFILPFIKKEKYINIQFIKFEIKWQGRS